MVSFLGIWCLLNLGNTSYFRALENIHRFALFRPKGRTTIFMVIDRKLFKWKLACTKGMRHQKETNFFFSLHSNLCSVTIDSNG